MERLIGTDYAGFVYVWLYVFNQALGKKSFNDRILASDRILDYAQSHTRVGYGDMLRESHDLVAYLALESAGDCKGQDHHRQTDRDAGCGNDDCRTRATFYTLVPTVQTSGQKLLHI